jgi:hypothetical protein
VSRAAGASQYNRQLLTQVVDAVTENPTNHAALAVRLGLLAALFSSGKYDCPRCCSLERPPRLVGGDGLHCSVSGDPWRGHAGSTKLGSETGSQKKKSATTL